MEMFMDGNGKRYLKMSPEERAVLDANKGVLPPQFNDPSWNARQPSMGLSTEPRSKEQRDVVLAQQAAVRAPVDLSLTESIAAGVANDQSVYPHLRGGDALAFTGGDIGRSVGVYGAGLALAPISGGSSLGAAALIGGGIGAADSLLREGLAQTTTGDLDVANLAKQTAIGGVAGGVGMGAGQGALLRMGARGYSPLAAGLGEALVSGVADEATRAGVDSSYDFSPTGAALGVPVYGLGHLAGKALRGAPAAPTPTITEAYAEAMRARGLDPETLALPAPSHFGRLNYPTSNAPPRPAHQTFDRTAPIAVPPTDGQVRTPIQLGDMLSASPLTPEPGAPPMTMPTLEQGVDPLWSRPVSYPARATPRPENMPSPMQSVPQVAPVSGGTVVPGGKFVNTAAGPMFIAGAPPVPGLLPPQASGPMANVPVQAPVSGGTAVPGGHFVQTAAGPMFIPDGRNVTLTEESLLAGGHNPAADDLALSTNNISAVRPESALTVGSQAKDAAAVTMGRTPSPQTPTVTGVRGNMGTDLLMAGQGPDPVGDMDMMLSQSTSPLEAPVVPAKTPSKARSAAAAAPEATIPAPAPEVPARTSKRRTKAPTAPVEPVVRDMVAPVPADTAPPVKKAPTQEPPAEVVAAGKKTRDTFPSAGDGYYRDWGIPEAPVYYKHGKEWYVENGEGFKKLGNGVKKDLTFNADDITARYNDGQLKPYHKAEVETRVETQDVTVLNQSKSRRNGWDQNAVANSAPTESVVSNTTATVKVGDTAHEIHSFVDAKGSQVWGMKDDPTGPTHTSMDGLVRQLESGYEAPAKGVTNFKKNYQAQRRTAAAARVEARASAPAPTPKPATDPKPRAGEKTMGTESITHNGVTVDIVKTRVPGRGVFLHEAGEKPLDGVLATAKDSKERLLTRLANEDRFRRGEPRAQNPIDELYPRGDMAPSKGSKTPYKPAGEEHTSALQDIMDDAVELDGYRIVTLDDLPAKRKVFRADTLADEATFQADQANNNKRINEMAERIANTNDVPQITVAKVGSKLRVVEGEDIVEAARRADFDGDIPAKMLVSEADWVESGKPRNPAHRTNAEVDTTGAMLNDNHKRSVVNLKKRVERMNNAIRNIRRIDEKIGTITGDPGEVRRLTSNRDRMQAKVDRDKKSISSVMANLEDDIASIDTNAEVNTAQLVDTLVYGEGKARPDMSVKKKQTSGTRSILNEERGAGLNLPQVISDYIDGKRAQSKAKQAERQHILDFVRDRDALSDRITKAKTSADREAARQELGTRMRKFLKDTGTAQAEIEALIRANIKHESHILEARRSADVSPYMAKKVTELRRLAKSYGLSPRGNKAQVAHSVAVFERAKAIAPDFKFTAEELKAKASSWHETHNNNKAQLAMRGDVSKDIETAYRAIFDVRGTVRKRLRDITGSSARAERAANLLEDAVHTGSKTKMQMREVLDHITGTKADLAVSPSKRKLKNSTRVSGTELYGSAGSLNAKVMAHTQSVDEWMHDLMMAMAESSAVEKTPHLLNPDGHVQSTQEAYITAIRSTAYGQVQYDNAVEAFAAIKAHTLDPRLAAGVITQAEYDDLARRKFYLPREFAREERGAGVLAHLFNMKPLDGPRTSTGSAKAMNENVPGLVQLAIESVNKEISLNNANRALHDIVGSMLPAQREAMGFGISTSKPKDPNVDAFRFIDKDGKKLYITTTDMGFAEGWNLQKGNWLRDREMVRVLTGVSWLKATTTGFLNPTFGFRNLPRDYFHTMQVADDYDIFLPKATAQWAGDMAATMRDAISTGDAPKGSLKDYFNQGGGSETLASQRHRNRRWLNGRGQGKLSEHASDFDRFRYNASTMLRPTADTLGTIADKMEWFNNFTENWARLAHRRRALTNLVAAEGRLNSGPISAKRMEVLEQQATHVARSRIDYSQGGWAAVEAGNFLPYFNPVMQGMRTTGEAFKRDKKRSGAMALQLAGLAGATYAGWNGLPENVETYDKIHPGEKAQNMIIVLPGFERIDPKTGREESLYLRIAKDDGYAKTSMWMGEQMARAYAGKEIEWESLTDLLLGFSGISAAGNLPPVLNAVMAYNYNKDTFTNKDVWTGQDVAVDRFGPDDAWRERDETTKEVWNMVGDLTGLSPKRGQRAAGKVFSGNNSMFRAFGMLTDIMIHSRDEQSPEKHEQTKQDALDILSASFGGTLRYTNSDAAISAMGQYEDKQRNIHSLDRKGLLAEAADMQVRPGEPDADMLDDLNTRITEQIPPEDLKQFATDVMKEAQLRLSSPLFRRVDAKIRSNDSPNFQAVQYFKVLVTESEEERQAAQVLMRVYPPSDKMKAAMIRIMSNPEYMELLERAGNGDEGIQFDAMKALKEISPAAK